MLLRIGDIGNEREGPMKFSTLKKEQMQAEDEAFGEWSAAKLEPGGVVVRTILVAVDFSEASRKALEFAATLAKQLKAEMVLLHVFERVPGDLKILEAVYVDTSFRDEAQKELAEWQAEAASVGLSVKTVFREGKIVDREINQAAVESKADLIILGRHGREGLLSKNPVKKVLGRATCPVLVV
jgi:nucleotide-binding universal stress UspA family protein